MVVRRGCDAGCYYDADLYLPTGEISDTQLHTMASTGNSDGRKLIVFTLTDFDPAGWQMPVSIGRKLQAFKDLQFPDLEFEVQPVALTGEQARSLDLPSTPLKETERRGTKWRAAMGWEQTEINALSTLQPDQWLAGPPEEHRPIPPMSHLHPL